jgi:hypothetical protein
MSRNKYSPGSHLGFQEPPCVGRIPISLDKSQSEVHKQSQFALLSTKIDFRTLFNVDPLFCKSDGVNIIP